MIFLKADNFFKTFVEISQQFHNGFLLEYLSIANFGIYYFFIY